MSTYFPESGRSDAIFEAGLDGQHLTRSSHSPRGAINMRFTLLTVLMG